MRRSTLARFVFCGLLTETAIVLIIVGLWRHDWREIAAGAFMLAVWPWLADAVSSPDDVEKDDRWD